MTPQTTTAPDARVEAILEQMTLQEKAGLLFHSMASVGPGGRVLGSEDQGTIGGPTRELIAQGINHFALMGPMSPEDIARWHNEAQEIASETRSQIPITVSSDPRHGFFSNPATGIAGGGFSQWPEPLGLAAVADEELVRRHAEVVRAEFAAVGIRVLLGPTLDVASDPRWARTLGTFGADPELVSRLALAYIEGLRGDDPHAEVAAMIKHFPGGGAQKDGEDPHFPYGREQVWPGGRFADHLSPFVSALADGVTQIMPYYGMPVGLRLDGHAVPEVGFAFNKRIITDLLRNKLSFEGIVCTDFTLVTDGTIFGAPMLARAWGVEHLDRHERVLAILDAGCDQLGGEASPDLVIDLVRDGRLSEKRVEESARRILIEKVRLGLFENRAVDVEAAAATAASSRHNLEADRAQRRSITAITGEGHTLPIQTGRRIFLENVSQHAAEKFGQVVSDPDAADIAIVRIDAPFERRTNGFENFFRAGALSFPPEQLERLHELNTRVPVVAAVFLDRPVLIGDLAERVSAVVADFGASDDALLASLFGNQQLEAELPFEVPRSMAAVERRREDVSFENEPVAFPHRHPRTSA